MLEFKKSLQNRAPCLITALTRSANKKTTRKKTNAKISKNKNFSASVLKKEKKKQKYCPLTKSCENTHCPTNKL